jgi:hypothetical protein
MRRAGWVVHRDHDLVRRRVVIDPPFIEALLVISMSLTSSLGQGLAAGGGRISGRSTGGCRDQVESTRKRNHRGDRQRHDEVRAAPDS